MKFLMYLPSLGAALMLAATPVSAQDMVEQGRALAEANCSRCHAIGKDDDSKLTEAPPFRTLGDKYPVEYLEEALGEGIVTAHPDMPVFELEPPQIAAFIEYLHSLKE